ncbi:MAG TPA: methyltransferase domain-containing protein [Candidatus Sulfotelmatobacter sp.]|nr:methyltransferase domain-containing protein [Candidatus Sulfotelmatobacter sp.]
MREEIGAAANAALVRNLVDRGTIRSQRIAAAFRRVPRHHFLPDLPLETVYTDQAIALRHEGGIAISSSSQPAMMAEMLELLQPKPGERVLEIGTGSGYNAALLAALVAPDGTVVSIDLEGDLVAAARERLRALGAASVCVIAGDGALGDLDDAPFDAIEATVGVADLPAAWSGQLREGGRLVAPFAIRSLQKIVAFERVGDRLESRATLDGAFMTLRGPSAWAETGAIALDDPNVIVRVSDRSTVDVRAIARAFASAFVDVAPARPLVAETLWDGFALWLALHEERFARLTALDEASATRVPNTIPDADAPSGRASTLGVALGRELAVFANVSGAVVVRRYGPDDGATARLQAQLIAWDDAGRPGNAELQVMVIPRDRGAARPTLARDPRARIVEQPSSTVLVSWR